MIVKRHKEIGDETKIWRKGALLHCREYSATALIIEDARSIIVHVKGKDSTPYVVSLRETLKEIFENYKVIKPNLFYKVLTPEVSKEDQHRLIAIDSNQNTVMLSEKIIRIHTTYDRDFLDPETARLYSLTKTALKYRIPNAIPVFVGSTYEDLKEHRVEIQDVLISYGMVIKSMEHFGATPNRPLDECLKNVNASKIYIGVFAHLYGSIDKASGKSFTHLEYEEAQHLKMPSLIYIIADEQTVTRKYHNNEAKLDELKNFSEKIILYKNLLLLKIWRKNLQ